MSSIHSSEKLLYRQVLDLAAQPSEVEATYLETLKRVQRKVEGKKK
jgi:hypothetical protein